MEQRAKTQFRSGKIRDIKPEEESSLVAVNLVLSGKSNRKNIAMVPAFVSGDGKDRALIFSREIADKIIRDHGDFLPENFVINANDWDGALINMRSFIKGILGDPNPNKINLLKKIPNSSSFLLIAADRQNGFFILTHYETLLVEGNELKSLLGRGDLVGPTGTPLGPADFLIAPSP